MLEELRASKLNERATLPTRKHPTDAGIDLYACIPETKEYNDADGEFVTAMAYIPPFSTGIIPTGITLEIPEGYAGLIWPKSRNRHLIGGGVVDAGYQGEILVKIFNPSKFGLDIQHGQAIGQLLLQKVETPAVVEVPLEEMHATATERGGTGGIVDQLK